MSSFPTDAGGAVPHDHGGGRHGHAAIVADGAGGAIVAWRDVRTRGTPGADLYAQRVLGSGEIAPGWPQNGAPICREAGDQIALRIVSDGTEGAFFVWEDWRGADADVYAQHVQSSGVLEKGWPSNGLMVCGAVGYQTSPAAAVDDQGLVAAWTDAASDPARVVAMRVTPDAVPTLVSRVTVDVAADRAIVQWYLSGGGAHDANVYRRTESTSWARQTSISADANGRITHVDRTVEPGTRYGYRIGILESEGEHEAGEIWVDIPRENALALGAPTPNPTAGADLVVPYLLASRERVRLKILDLAGRVLEVHEIDDPSTGPRRWNLALRPPPGIYHVRLSQSGHSRTRRIAVTW